jgi:hypothetical protein
MRTTIAIVVAAVVHWLLGAAWFTYFSSAWIAGTRLSEVEIVAAKAHPSAVPYVVSLIANLFMAWALLWVLRRIGAVNAAAGAQVGLVLGLCLAAIPMVTEMVFELRTTKFIVISAMYPLIGCVLMGTIVGAIAAKSAS